jgi:mRNA-degrading endonuclease RelE of RelBE toxin-antitoxin system
VARTLIKFSPKASTNIKRLFPHSNSKLSKFTKKEKNTKINGKFAPSKLGKKCN